MADLTVTTVTMAACAYTAATLSPILCKIGVDPVSMGSGLLGCLALQLMLPGEDVRWWRIAATTAGSIIVASVLTPVAFPWAVKIGAILPGVPADRVQTAVAFSIGFGTKPLSTLGLRKFRVWSSKWVKQDANN